MDRTLLTVAATVVLLLTGGCGSLFGQKKLEQCRGESERLLLEYRTERDARQRTEIANRALVDRVADLEKRLAVIHDTAGSRLATRGEAASVSSAADPGEIDAAAVRRPSDDAASLRQSAAPSASDSSAAQGNPTAPDPWRAVPRGR